MTDIATDMDVLRDINIKSLLTLLFMEKAKLTHTQIKALEEIINGKCFSSI